MKSIFLLFVVVLLGANTANGCSGGGDDDHEDHTDHDHDHETGNLAFSLKTRGSSNNSCVK